MDTVTVAAMICRYHIAAASTVDYLVCSKMDFRRCGANGIDTVTVAAIICRYHTLYALRWTSVDVELTAWTQ